MGLLVLLTVAILSLAGCLKPVSLDAYGYVITIGVDRGEAKKYYYTFALQRELEGQDTSGEGGAAVLSCEGNSIFEAVSELEGNIPYSLNFSRTGFITFSRELAEGDAVKEFVSASLDALKIRTSAVMIVSEGDACEFIDGMYANNDANITKLQSALMLDKQKTGMVTVMSISRLIEACEDGRFDYCSAYGVYDAGVITDTGEKKSESEGEDPTGDAERGERAGGLRSRIAGAALFSGWSMTGTLTRGETVWLNIANGEFKSGVVDVKYGEGEESVSVGLSLEKVTRRLAIGGDGAVTATVDVVLGVGVRRMDQGTPPVEIDAWLTEDFARYAEEMLLSVFMKCRFAESDAMRFGTEAVRKFRTAEEWERFCWKERYLDLVPEFRVVTVNAEKYAAEGMQ